MDAYLDYLLEHLDLVRMSETASRGARYRVGAYGTRHTAILLAAAGAADPEHDAHALLAALAAEHVAALLPELGEERIRAGRSRSPAGSRGRATGPRSARPREPPAPGP
ncbi:hypothetical protein ACFQ0M_14010 [Kitasatospora aburaviensis]